MFDLKLNNNQANISIFFHPVEVVGRGSETPLQVVEKIINLAGKGLPLDMGHDNAY